MPGAPIRIADVDKLKLGIRGPWLRSLPALAVALIAAGSVIGYRLIRKIRRQNLQLETLQRLDALTGLDSRAHWQQLAENLLRQHLRQGRRASLMLPAMMCCAALHW
jgi:diguanylate cyclase